MPPPLDRLAEVFGAIDVYLFDQLLRGRVAPDARVLDAGCGAGRNLVYLAGAGVDVTGVDRDPLALDEARRRLPHARLRRAELDALPFDDDAFDVVLCNAVLHFADSLDHAARCLDECRRVLAPGGLFWARLATSIGIEDRVRPLPGRPGWYALPDGSERLLHTEADLHAHAARLGAELLDPLKTTNVAGLRAMTTWVLVAR